MTGYQIIDFKNAVINPNVFYSDAKVVKKVFDLVQKSLDNGRYVIFKNINYNPDKPNEAKLSKTVLVTSYTKVGSNAKTIKVPISISEDEIWYMIIQYQTEQINHIEIVKQTI